MTNTVIKVENLGKRYQLQHEKQEPYHTLRDVISNRLRGLLKLRGTHVSSVSVTEDFWALKDISFNIRQGDRVGIIGRNGAGKSTLLKMLSRIAEPTTGRISIHGRIASLLEVGTGFHPELSGRENIYLNGSILGMSREEIKRKFDEIVAFAEIERFLDTPVKRYSSGMYVRLAFAVAAHLESEILIVDEVLAVGDTDFQKKCLGKMEQVSKGEGRTVLLVSHNLAIIKSLCDKGILLEKGMVKAFGSIETVIESYLSNKEKACALFVNTEKFSEKISVDAIRLLNDDDEVLLGHPCNIPFRIQVNYSLEVPLQFFVSVHIHDSNLETILFSRDFECDEQYLETRRPGDYTLNIRVPALLVPGNYTISVHITNLNPKIKIGGFDYICPFEIIEGNDHRSKFGMPIRGKVMADMRWITNKK